ncbi:ER membrane protein complex subunit 8-like [Ptychodera flava]|uniref:ER membrane protein complex subunit 8-like n=1 Tax=Ptychodera flava TaxID=63121 RepID=UPI00396A0C11
MAEIIMSIRAYSKIVFHAAKYPHCSVNGVLLADKKKLKENKSVIYVDAIPLFHLALGLAPMLEVALTRIDSYCKLTGSVVAGYYQANEHLHDSEMNAIAVKIADKIRENATEAYVFMVDNRKMSADCKDIALKLFSYQENKNEWKSKDIASITLEDDEKCLAITSDLLRSKLQKDLVDFDNHLDDISLDWLNQDINSIINQCL